MVLLVHAIADAAAEDEADAAADEACVLCTKVRRHAPAPVPSYCYAASAQSGGN